MKFTTSDGLQLAYEDEGEGVPVLCLPGLTRNARDFDDLAAVLKDVRLIRLTYRGRDGSDYDPDFNNYNILRELQDALELLDYLEVPKAVFLGTSRGGMISMAAAAVAKDRMLGVILNDIGPDIDKEGLDRIFEYLGIQPNAQTIEQLVGGLKATMGAEFPTLSDALWELNARRWYDVSESGIRLKYDPKLRDAALAQVGETPPDLWPVFDLLAGLPLAVIRGANSDLLSMDTVREMQSRHPDLVFANVPDRGHVPFLDEPESLAAIRAVLAQVAA